MLKELDVVALNKELRATHCDSGQPIVLMRGQVGTVLEVYEQGASCLVEFADKDGVAFALEVLDSECLIPLHYHYATESA